MIKPIATEIREKIQWIFSRWLFQPKNSFTKRLNLGNNLWEIAKKDIGFSNKNHILAQKNSNDFSRSTKNGR